MNGVNSNDMTSLLNAHVFVMKQNFLRINWKLKQHNSLCMWQHSNHLLFSPPTSSAPYVPHGGSSKHFPSKFMIFNVDFVSTIVTNTGVIQMVNFF